MQITTIIISVRHANCLVQMKMSYSNTWSGGIRCFQAVLAIRLLCVMVNDGTVILKKEGENRRRLLRVLLLGNYTIVK